MSLTKIINSPRVLTVYQSGTECFMHPWPSPGWNCCHSLHDATESREGNDHCPPPDAKSRDAWLDHCGPWGSDIPLGILCLLTLSTFQDGCCLTWRTTGDVIWDIKHIDTRACRAQKLQVSGVSEKEAPLVDRTVDRGSEEADLVSLYILATIRRINNVNSPLLKDPKTEQLVSCPERNRTHQDSVTQSFGCRAGDEKHLGGFLKLHVLCPGASWYLL